MYERTEHEQQLNSSPQQSSWGSSLLCMGIYVAKVTRMLGGSKAGVGVASEKEKNFTAHESVTLSAVGQLTCSGLTVLFRSTQINPNVLSVPTSLGGHRGKPYLLPYTDLWRSSVWSMRQEVLCGLDLLHMGLRGGVSNIPLGTALKHFL